MKHFVWIDMEWTGVDPEKDVILEFATIITDEQLQIVEQFDPVTIGYDLDTLEFNFARDNGTFMRYFEESGLLKRTQQSTITIEQAETILLEQISKHCTPKECYLAGNSVWSDAAFIKKYMPKAYEFFHYRVLDVTAIKLLKQSWYPDVSDFEKADTHDALNDIKESLAELRYYRKHLFK